MSDHKKVKIDGKEYIAFVNKKKGKPGIVAMGADYDSGVSCPPIPEAVCPLNYDAVCTGGTVWCMFNEGEG